MYNTIAIYGIAGVYSMDRSPIYNHDSKMMFDR